MEKRSQSCALVTMQSLTTSNTEPEEVHPYHETP
jgi:hypothetical protein